jgi:uncharacterized YigZ family protein
MSDKGRYPIPARRCRSEAEVKRSRFIATLAPAPTVAEARAFIEEMRAEFSDASHNCWAYLVGPPGSSGHVGMSDDGEPHYTAGRPMLTMLLHSEVGDVAAVVTRYFGGTKLGKGGLVRAYSGGVRDALQELEVTERVRYQEMDLLVDYTWVTHLKRMLPDHEATIEEERFGADVSFRLKLPEHRLPAFVAALEDTTNGQAIVQILD